MSTPSIDTAMQQVVSTFVEDAMAAADPKLGLELRRFSKGIRQRFRIVWSGSSNLLTRILVFLWNPDILLHFFGVSNGAVMWDANHSSIQQIVENIHAQRGKIKEIVIYAHGANRVEDAFVVRWVQQRFGPLLDAGIYFIAVGWNSDPLRSARNTVHGPNRARWRHRNRYLRWVLGRLGERMSEFFGNRAKYFKNRCGWINSYFQLLDDSVIREIWSTITKEARVANTGKDQYALSRTERFFLWFSGLFDRKLPLVTNDKLRQKGPLPFLLDALYQARQSAGPMPGIHLIGHSAGTVLLEGLTSYALKAGIPITSATLWGAGTDMHQFHATYGAALQAHLLQRAVIININRFDESEAADSNSILLTLQRSAKPDEAITGLARNVEADPGMQTLMEAGKVFHIVSGQSAHGRPLCSCVCHSHFDDDLDCWQTTMRLILTGSGN
jgi:hypothetical protein